MHFLLDTQPPFHATQRALALYLFKIKKKKPVTKPGEIVGCGQSACADMLFTPKLTEAMNYMNTTWEKSLLPRHTGCTGALHH